MRVGLGPVRGSGAHGDVGRAPRVLGGERPAWEPAAAGGFCL